MDNTGHHRKTTLRSRSLEGTFFRNNPSPPTSFSPQPNIGSTIPSPSVAGKFKLVNLWMICLLRAQTHCHCARYVSAGGRNRPSPRVAASARGSRARELCRATGRVRRRRWGGGGGPVWATQITHMMRLSNLCIPSQSCHHITRCTENRSFPPNMQQLERLYRYNEEVQSSCFPEPPVASSSSNWRDACCDENILASHELEFVSLSSLGSSCLTDLVKASTLRAIGPLSPRSPATLSTCSTPRKFC
jgi:hypothetical protein